MKEFALIFRNSNPATPPSPEQIQKVMETWMNWMGGIAAQDKLVDRGNRLSISESKVVRSGNTVTDGPYTEIKEFINGYIVVKAAKISDAVAIAKECPVLKHGGNVEVRQIVSPDDNS